ncbi:MAG: carboxymuconolactone decarboxylase family protein [Deltaproteobacteria bacterium]|nr:carboxymuconolactone decarboxylase family protein [Deltaproteobacteria bacterium]
MYLPKPFKKFESQYPEIAKLYEELGVKCQAAGPLDAKTRYLINLGIAVGAVSPGAVKSHARKAIEHGASTGEVYHALLLALTTVGFPAMIAAMGWVEEVVSAATP